MTQQQYFNNEKERLVRILNFLGDAQQTMQYYERYHRLLAASESHNENSLETVRFFEELRGDCAAMQKKITERMLAIDQQLMEAA